MQTPVGVEKVTEIGRSGFSRSTLEESDPAHGLFDSDRRRPADHDGATRPFRSAIISVHKRHGEVVSFVLQEQLRTGAAELIDGSLDPTSLLAMVATRNGTPNHQNLTLPMLFGKALRFPRTS